MTRFRATMSAFVLVTSAVQRVELSALLEHGRCSGPPFDANVRWGIMRRRISRPLPTI